MSGCVCLGVYVWVCMSGCVCLGVYVLVCMSGCVCLGVYVWVCMSGCSKHHSVSNSRKYQIDFAYETVGSVRYIKRKTSVRVRVYVCD